MLIWVVVRCKIRVVWDWVSVVRFLLGGMGVDSVVIWVSVIVCVIFGMVSLCFSVVVVVVKVGMFGMIL